MFNLTECHFIFNGINSRKYDLVIAHIESEAFRPIAGNKDGQYIFNKATRSRHIISDRYDNSPLSVDVEIVKCSGEPLNRSEIREIERWLFTNSKYRKLYIDPVDDPLGETYEVQNGRQVLEYLNCRFVNAEKIFGNGGVMGFRCEIETDSYMAWQDPTVAFCTVNSMEVDVPGAHILLGDPDGDGVVSAADSNIALSYYTERFVSGKTMEDAMAAVSERFGLDMTREKVIACDMDFGSFDSMLADGDIMDAELRRWMTMKYGSGSADGVFHDIDFRDTVAISRAELVEKFYEVYAPNNSSLKISTDELQEWVEMRYDHVINGVDDSPYSLAAPEPDVGVEDSRTILSMYTNSVAQYDVDNTYIDISSGKTIIDSTTNDVRINVNTDLDGYTYPVITIYTGSTGGEIEIVNLSEKVFPYLMNSYRHFIIDTEPNSEYVIDSTVSSYSPLGVQIKRGEFPRLLDGENKLFFGGNLKYAKIEWSNRRFL